MQLSLSYLPETLIPRTELIRILSRLGTDGPPSAFETQVLDFKQPSPRFKETLTKLADAAVCFANADGGTIVLGVRDNATKRSAALVGAEPALSVDSIRKGIFERTQPAITPFVEEVYEDGVRLLVIEIPQGVTPHSNTAGLATRRVGTDCAPYTPDQQREVLVARGYVDWSAEPSALPSSDLSELEIERLRQLLLTAGRDELAALDARHLLESLRLVRRDGIATNAAVLLLGTSDALRDVIPNHDYSYQFRPSPGSEATARFRRNRPLLAAAEDLISAASSRATIRPLNIAGGRQLQLVDYPESALREVIVNALIHRAYDVPGSVDIEHAPERLSIQSPGGLVAGVTPDNILSHPSTPRHRLLAEVVSICQLAEKTGQGIDRAFREMLRAGKEPPEFNDTGFSVRVILGGGIGNDAFVRFLEELPPELATDVEVLLALATLRNVDNLDAQRLATVIQRTPNEAQHVLERLADRSPGILEATRSTARRPYPRYRLRPEPLAALARSLSYHRRVPDQIDAKVIEHITEYGFVTNRTLQRIFDVSVFAARDMLKDLQTRQVIQKIGTARGGKGVKYEAGRNFNSSPTSRK